MPTTKSKEVRTNIVLTEDILYRLKFQTLKERTQVSEPASATRHGAPTIRAA